MEWPNILCNLKKIKYITIIIHKRVKGIQIIDSELIYFIYDSCYNSKKVNQYHFINEVIRLGTVLILGYWLIQYIISYILVNSIKLNHLINLIIHHMKVKLILIVTMDLMLS